ncbi:MAG: hypothetical protein JST89_14185 [Cyanobacteria bacterium SZAS-4]|nr:hypothetical protein [Cyanobacteria bacterium SZAS-4]
MKFSAILVSLSLPLAAQSAAQAEDAGTADFLKASLSTATAPANKAQKPRIVLQALSPRTAEVKTAYGVKLRPFVPNRKLPSKRDLELELLSQTPRMAAPPQTSLSGQISEFGAQSMTEMPRSYDRSISTYDAATLNRYAAPRVTANQVLATPGQVRVNRQVRKPVARPMSFQPQVATSTQSNDWLGQPRAGERMIRQGGALLAQAPAAIPSEERLADLGYPSAEEIATPPAPVPSSSGNDIIRPPQVQQQLESQSGPGPAPFPLSLLGQDQLKSLMRSRVRTNQPAPPPSYFGSWHGPQTSHNLPPGGFQTHMQSHGFAAPQASAANYSHFAPRPTKHHSPAGAGRANMMQAAAQKPHQEMRIAVYPPYAHQPPMAP